MFLPYKIYKKSPLANFVSITGVFVGLAGAGFVFSGYYFGIILVAIWVGTYIGADKINENTKFKQFKEMIETKGLDKIISESIPDAIAAYKAFPNQKTKDYICSLNPEFSKCFKDSNNTN